MTLFLAGATAGIALTIAAYLLGRWAGGEP